VIEPLRALVVEDSEDDGLLLLRELKRGGYETVARRVETPDEMRRALDEGSWDVVLSDYSLPSFSAPSALQVLKERGLDLPFLIVSRNVGEDLAVEAMKAGAHDYIMKDKMARLVPAIRRELREAQERGTRRRAEQALKESETRFRSLIENASDIIMVLDKEGVLRYESPSLERVLGYMPSDLLGRNVREFVHADDLVELEAAFRSGPGATTLLSFRFRHQSGSFRDLEAATSNLLDDPGVAGVVVNARDVTERRRAAEQLRESEQRYALAAQGANDGLWDWDLRTSTVYYSPRWKLMLGYSEAEVARGVDEWFSRVHREDVPRMKAAVSAHLAGETSHFESEHRMLHKDGGYRWMLSRGLAVRDAQGRATRMSGSQTDITVRKLAEEQLLHDAFHDALTALPNRALFLDRLGLAVGRAKRRKDALFAVLFIDLDRFKVVNDGLGHMCGDQLLVAIARRLEAGLRPGDTLARFGGDEFTVLLDDLGHPDDVTMVADRIHKDLEKPFVLDSLEVYMTASIGIAVFGPHYEHPEDLLRDADTAMYRAKAHGRARHEIFDAAMHARAVSLLRLTTDLKRALDRRELRLHYQPIVSLSDFTITGFEALVRWDNNGRGAISPSEFVPVAEESGLIVPMGSWVLHEACRQVGEWQRLLPDRTDLTVSVNLSVRQLGQPDLVDDVRRALAESGLPARSLHLEITESLMMETSEAGTAMLQELRDLGLELHMDDFGTGYSSLSTLHRFPIDRLKIDHSFVRNLPGSRERALLRSIVTLGKNLQMEVIAEGVETHEQLALLSDLGCEYAQGFLFARALDAASATALLTSASPWPDLKRPPAAAAPTRDETPAFS